MKNYIKRLGALLMALAILCSFTVVADAATVPTATIDTTRNGSIDIYKYDLTRANTDNAAAAMIDSYVSTGVRDTALEALLDDGTVNDLGNGQESYGYSIKGVEFRYLRIADIVAYSETESNGTHKDMVLYKINSERTDFLDAIGVEAGDAYHVPASFGEAGYLYFTSDTLIDALADALTSNSTTVKNALELYMNEENAARMPETDAHGHTRAEGLLVGLYLLVESKVPEMVTATVDPFLVSIPMTTVSGTNATNGGQEWNYNVTVYPKNNTGIPSLEKTLREDKNDTGKNDGSGAINDGYAHNATASQGDRLEYQIISKLPAITSAATSLTTYTFLDTFDEEAGAVYNGNEAQKNWIGDNFNANDVVIEFFKDAACTNKITTWKENDATPKFTVTYSGSESSHVNSMTLTMTNAGLREINTANTVYTAAGALDRGYSNCYMRTTYSCTLVPEFSNVYGDVGNKNTVVLTWQRSNMSYYDTLVDDTHYYTYALDLEKQFSDGAGDFSKVQFKIKNVTDNYWIKAVQDDDGLFFVSDHVAAEADATILTVELGDTPHALRLYGLEDDEYLITEIQTDNGYTLLKDGIHFVITATDDPSRPCGVYGEDVLGLVQNDPRYVTFDGYKQLAHNHLTASATMDGDAVEMEEDPWSGYDSQNAVVPMTVINTRGPELPKTGDNGVWRYSVYGILLMSVAAVAIILVARKKKPSKQ